MKNKKIHLLYIFIITAICLLFMYSTCNSRFDNRNVLRCQMSRVDSMEYYFNPKNDVITVRFFNGNSSIIFAGLLQGEFDKAKKSLSFTILVEPVDGKSKSSPAFKMSNDGYFVVSFKVPSFNPKYDKLIYDDFFENPKPVPFKGMASEPEVLKINIRK